MKKYLVFAISIILLAQGFYACEKEYVKHKTVAEAVGQMDTVSFANEIIPFFDSKCVICHDIGGDSPELAAGVAYDNLINGGYINTSNPEASSIYVKISSTSGSHTSFATAGEQSLLLNWIKQGALNN